MEQVAAGEIFSFLFTGINAVFDFFQRYILVGDWGYIIIGSVVFAMFVRLIIAPLFGVSGYYGGAASDTVSTSNKSTPNYGNARYPVNEYDDAIIVLDESVPRLGGK